MTVFSDFIGYAFSALTYVIYSIFGNILTLVHKTAYKESQRYDVSCHVMKIIWKRKFFMIDIVSPSDFIASHVTFTSPLYVLHHTVSLYCFTKEEAIFVQVPQNVDVNSSSTNSFLYIGQFQHATHIIKMPLASLFRLTQEMSRDDVDICYLANTGRCGSTLLSQTLEKVPGTLVLAEPDSLTNLGQLMREKQLTNVQYEELLVATIRVLCKPYPGINRYCIKTRSCASQHVASLANHFPEMKFIFGYRNSMKTVSSLLRLMVSETAQSTAMYFIDSDWFSKLFPFFRRRMHFYFCYILEQEPVLFRKEDLNSVEQFTYAWCMCIVIMKEFIDQKKDALPILYEDMIKDKSGTLQKVFEYLNIDEKHLRNALKAFEADSQEGSVLGRKNIDNQHRRRVSYKNKTRASRITKMFGLPDLGEPFKF